MRNTRVSYSFGEVNTYIQETQLPNTGNDPVKYSLDFVPTVEGGGASPITDYVPKSIGGTFDSLIGYTTDLTSSIISNNHITNKKYVDDAIAAALGGGAVIDYSLARPYFSSSAGTPLSYASATGIFTLNKNLSQYTNDIGFITDYTVTESDVTAHQAALTILASQIDGLDAVISTDFNTLFDARFGIKSIADLGTKSHLSLTNLPGSPEGFHLNVSAYTNVNRYATTSQDGILRAADWNTFNSKLDAINGDGTTITISGGNISVIPAGVDHDQLLNYVEAQHRVINDSGTANTDLWSASKIISYVSDANISFTDITTNNASTTKHGFLPKLNNNSTTFLNGRAEWVTVPTTEDLDAPVITMIVDNTYNPGASPTDGDRYLIIDSSSLHANFGTINKDLSGTSLTLADNDIVQYVTSAGEFRIAFDASAATRNRMILVETDIYLTDNANWAYSYFTDVWVYRGSTSSHNSLSGIQGGEGDYKYHLDATQYALVGGITSSFAELNYLDGTTVTANRIMYGDGTKITNSANLTFDGTTLYANADVNIATGKKYKINNVDLSYSDVGAQPLNAKLTTIAGLSLVHGDLLFVNGSADIAPLNIGASGKFLRSNGAGVDPSWETMSGSFLPLAGGTLTGEVVGTIATMTTVRGNGLELPHTIKKAASNNLRNSHDAEASTSNKSATKLKTITLTNGFLGTMRVSAQIKTVLSNPLSATTTFNIYRNGTLLQQLAKTTLSVYGVEIIDITQNFNVGDTLELWVETGGPGTVTAYAKELRLSYDDAPTVTVASVNS